MHAVRHAVDATFDTVAGIPAVWSAYSPNDRASTKFTGSACDKRLTSRDVKIEATNGCKRSCLPRGAVVPRPAVTAVLCKLCLASRASSQTDQEEMVSCVSQIKCCQRTVCLQVEEERVSDAALF